ncbi:MAG: methyltransferase domain-containing protein [Desulfotomaculaceae bacterium]|nr:methyltransferase domain-containing protein [Desulfotomaculaceae bacterium]
MNFDWNSETIRWYQAANEYTGFNKKIAALIAPKLAGYTSLCDIGCGLGLVDMELCQSINKITCIDISGAAIAFLKKTAADRNIKNIHALLQDCSHLTGTWDVIYISFFGSRIFKSFLPHCKKLIVVVSAKNKPELYPGSYRKYKKNTVAAFKQDLDSQGIPYSLTEATFNFGQPLASLEDAHKFVLNYSPQASPDEVANFLSQNLTETDDKTYPLFLPHNKSIGIFEIKGELFIPGLGNGYC